MHHHPAGMFARLRVFGKYLVGQINKIAGEPQNLAQRFAILTGLGKPVRFPQGVHQRTRNAEKFGFSHGGGAPDGGYAFVKSRYGLKDSGSRFNIAFSEARAVSIRSRCAFRFTPS